MVANVCDVLAALLVNLDLIARARLEVVCAHQLHVFRSLPGSILRGASRRDRQRNTHCKKTLHGDFPPSDSRPTSRPSAGYWKRWTSRTSTSTLFRYAQQSRKSRQAV